MANSLASAGFPCSALHEDDTPCRNISVKYRESQDLWPRCDKHRKDYRNSCRNYKLASEKVEEIFRQRPAIIQELGRTTDLEEISRIQNAVEVYLDALFREHGGRREHSRRFFASTVDPGHQGRIDIIGERIAGASQLLDLIEDQKRLVASEDRLSLEAGIHPDIPTNQEEGTFLSPDSHFYQISAAELQDILQAVWGYRLDDSDLSEGSEGTPYSPPDSPPGLDPLAEFNEGVGMSSISHPQGLGRRDAFDTTWENQYSLAGSAIPYPPDSPPDSPPALRPVTRVDQGNPGYGFDRENGSFEWSPTYSEASELSESWEGNFRTSNSDSNHVAPTHHATPLRSEREMVGVRETGERPPPRHEASPEPMVALANEDGREDASPGKTWSWGKAALKVVGALAVAGAAAMMRGRKLKRGGS